MGGGLGAQPGAAALAVAAAAALCADPPGHCAACVSGHPTHSGFGHAADLPFTAARQHSFGCVWQSVGHRFLREHRRRGLPIRGRAAAVCGFFPAAAAADAGHDGVRRRRGDRRSVHQQRRVSPDGRTLLPAGGGTMGHGRSRARHLVLAYFPHRFFLVRRFIPNRCFC